MVAVDPTARRILRVRLPAAEAVYLMGPFNNWSTTGTPMARSGDGWWEATVPLVDPERLRIFVWEAGQRCGRFVPLDPRSATMTPASAEAVICEPASESPVTPVLRP